MTPEEREQFKDAEKAHLRTLKKLKEAAQHSRRRNSALTAVTDMIEALDDALDTHQEMVGKLELETARNEARIDMALEKAAREEAADGEPTEEENARALVEHLKLQMGMKSEEVKDGAKSIGRILGSRDEPMDKTIGSMK